MFLTKLCFALSNFDLNVLGLFTGVLGAVTVTIFGLPSISLLNQGMYVEMQVTTRMRAYCWLSRVGLVLILIGFILQLVPAVSAIKLS